jgi:DNA-binding transcriptional LysR family regulator
MCKNAQMAQVEELNWDDLRYFLLAATAKSLAGAARAARVEHTTIGRRLSALERALGAALMLRGREGLQLTPLGEQLVPLAAAVERSVNAVRDLVASERSRVRLAVPSGFTRLFSDGIAKFARENADVTLEIVSGARPVDLKKGEADLAIRTSTIVDKDLIARKLFDSGFALYASEAYLARKPAPRDPNDLSGHDVVGFDVTLSKVSAVQWLNERAVKANVVMRSREVIDIMTAVLGGIGLSVLPCWIGDAEPLLRRLTHDVIAVQSFSLVYPRESKLSPEVRAVIRFVTALIHDKAPALLGKRN